MKEKLITILILLMGGLLSAQSSSQKFTRYGEKEGLASNQVFTVMQDHFGYIWIGTLNGVSRFDGYTFKNYELELDDPTSLQTQMVHAIYEDANYDLWIGGLGSLSKYNRVEDNFISYTHPIFQDNSKQQEVVETIIEDRTGRLLIGMRTRNGEALQKGLFFFDKQSQSIQEYVLEKAVLHMLPPKEEPQNHAILLDTLGTGDVQMFARDAAGDIWFAGSAGIAKLNESEHKIEAYWAAGKEDGFYGLTLLEREDHTFWLGVLHHGLYNFDPRTSTFQFLAIEPENNPWEGQSHPHPHIQDIIQIDDHHLWIAAGEGLIQFDMRDNTSAFIPVSSPGGNDGGESFFPTDLIQDAAGGIWIANRAGGAIRYETGAGYFQTLTNEMLEGQENLMGWNASSWVVSFFEKPNGNILVIRRSGVISELNRQLQWMGLAPAIPGQLIGLYADPQGAAWATHPAGVHQYFPEKNAFVPFPLPAGTRNSVAVVLKDRQGILWLGVQGALLSYDEHTNRFNRCDLEEPDPATSKYVNLLLEDRSGNLWIGTDSGLFKYMQKENTVLRMFGPDQPQTLHSQDINSLYEDQSGIIWIGTWQGGLHRYDPETDVLRVFTKKEGLPSNAIQGILGDEVNGALWLSTFNGISRFDLTTERFSNFGLEDGIQGKQFADKSALKTNDGLFLFGGINGMTAFRPEEVVNNLDTPSVLITDFKLFNETVLPAAGSILQKPIYETEEIRLKHDENDISFGFVAFQYSDPEKIKYAYKLEGFDADWRYVGSQRSATYTNLPPGNYTFRLKAANKHDIWNEEGRSVQISIAKPWWQTWWAYALYVLALAGSVWAFIQWRLYYLRLKYEKDTALAAEASAKAANEAKSAFLSTVSHELRTPLTSIIGFSKLNQKSLQDRILPGIKEVDHKAQKAAQKLGNNLEIVVAEGERLTALINDLLDLAKIEAGKVNWNMTEVHPGELIERTIAATAALFEQKPNLKLIKNIPDNLPAVSADRDRILQVLINLISNAVKFTDAGVVTVGVRMSPVGLPTEASAKVGGGDSSMELIFFVADTGPGIPTEHRESIFEKFKQVDDNQSGKPKGTGLGLPICKEIIAYHGGRIWVESTTGKGSIFYFSLPY